MQDNHEVGQHRETGQFFYFSEIRIENCIISNRDGSHFLLKSVRRKTIQTSRQLFTWDFIEFSTSFWWWFPSGALLMALHWILCQRENTVATRGSITVPWQEVHAWYILLARALWEIQFSQQLQVIWLILLLLECIAKYSSSETGCWFSTSC